MTRQQAINCANKDKDHNCEFQHGQELYKMQMFFLRTLPMLKTEYPSFGKQYHACLYPGTSSCQSISRHSIGCVGQTTCIVSSRVNFICLGQAKSKIQFKMWIHVYTCSLWSLKTIQHVKSYDVFMRTSSPCQTRHTVGSVIHHVIASWKLLRPSPSQVYQMICR